MRVDDAGCDVFPDWANGAKLLVPLTEEQVQEAKAYKIQRLDAARASAEPKFRYIHMECPSGIFLFQDLCIQKSSQLYLRIKDATTMVVILNAVPTDDLGASSSMMCLTTLARSGC